jgi:hypothetical protein
MSKHRGLSATKVLGALLLLSVPARLKAQVLVAPSDITQVSKILDSSTKGGALQCQFKSSDPFLDYDLRYEVAFFVSTSTEQLRPGDQETAYLRVTPQGGTPVYLTRTFELAPDANREKIPQLTATVGGEFNVGGGRYLVDLALVDQQTVSCYKHWDLETGKYSGAFPALYGPHTVQARDNASWSGKLDPNGIRLSVLVDVVPFNPSSQRLGGQDRSILQQSLATLLRAVPCRSVNVTVFNLDQNAEVFRQEGFDSRAFDHLLKVVLPNLEFNTAPYQALQPGSKQEYLVKLVQEQMSAKEPFDAVVFLGANAASKQNSPIVNLGTITPHFFYLEFFPPPSTQRIHFPKVNEDTVTGDVYTTNSSIVVPVGDRSPDMVEHLTKDLHGTVFRITSPKDLISAISKMERQLKSAPSGGSSP